MVLYPFNGRLSGTARVSRYQKGKTNLDLLEQEIVHYHISLPALIRLVLVFVGYNLAEELSKSFSFLHHTHVHTTHNRFTALWNFSGTTRVSRYQEKHSPTHTHRGHQSSQSAFSIYYEPWHPLYSIHMLYSLFPQSLSNVFTMGIWLSTL